MEIFSKNFKEYENKKKESVIKDIKCLNKTQIDEAEFIKVDLINKFILSEVIVSYDSEITYDKKNINCGEKDCNLTDCTILIICTKLLNITSINPNIIHYYNGGSKYMGIGMRANKIDNNIKLTLEFISKPTKELNETFFLNKLESKEKEIKEMLIFLNKGILKYNIMITKYINKEVDKYIKKLKLLP